MNVLFLLPVGPGGGGVHSVMQEASEMRRLGNDARVAVLHEHRRAFEHAYASRMDTRALLAPFQAWRTLGRLAREADVVVATAHQSVPMLKRVMSWNPRIAPAYYVQDYEPYFFPRGSRRRAAAARSYTCIRGMTLFAKTRWLTRTVGDRHQVQVHKVIPGIDHRVYRPAPASTANGSQSLVVAAMVRPRTPRRAAARTMRVLRRVKSVLGEAVRIRIFGVSEDDAQFQRLEREFEYENHGPLDRDGVASVLRSADLFVDLSDYQAFGRTALEAMACGCAVIVPRAGGTGEYARHEWNSLVIDTRDETAAFAAIVRLAERTQLRGALIERGLETAARYTLEAAARSELAVLESARERWLSQSFFRRWLRFGDLKPRLRRSAMQTIVLGMHRSGTSMVARVLNLMGMYFGPEGIGTGFNAENEKGFWERKDVRRLNDFVLHSQNCDWHDVARFNLEQLSHETREQFLPRARQLVLELDAHRPWFLKDPRFCLLFGLWRNVLEVPVCVFVYRHPVEVALSLQKRNGLPVRHGLRLWERYVTQGLEDTERIPRVLVHYAHFLQAPVRAAGELRDALIALGVSDLTSCNRTEVIRFVDPSLCHHHHEELRSEEPLTASQRQLVETLEAGRFPDQAPVHHGARVGLERCEYTFPRDAATAGDRTQPMPCLEERLSSLQRTFEHQQRRLEEGYRRRLRAVAAERDALADESARLRGENRALHAEIEAGRRQAAALRNKLNAQRCIIAQNIANASTVLEDFLYVTGPLRDAASLADKRDREICRLRDRVLRKEAAIQRLRRWHKQRRLSVPLSPNALRAAFAFRRWEARFIEEIIPPLPRPLSALSAAIAARLNRTRTAQGRSKTLQRELHATLRRLSRSPFEALPPRQQSGKGNGAESSRARTAPSVDVVICVHDALDAVRGCLESVLAARTPNQRLIVVDDASAPPTRDYLREIVPAGLEDTLLRNEERAGYVQAANTGLRASTGDYVILLNSDTVVSPAWSSKLLACLQSAPDIGIAGPLSNAATWQSVPEPTDKRGKFKVNSLPKGMTPADVNRLLETDAPEYPRVPLLNGFCLAIRRTVLDTIGYFDDTLFPDAYGEENDYCFRAADAGFGLAVAVDTYVFHLKSQSYTPAERRRLSKQARKLLIAKYGAPRVSQAVKTLRLQPVLTAARDRIRAAAATHRSEAAPVVEIFGAGEGTEPLHSDAEDGRDSASPDGAPLCLRASGSEYRR